MSCSLSKNNSGNLKKENFHQSEFSHMGIGSRNIGLQLSTQNEVLGDETQVIAELTLPKGSVSALSYKWKLGSGIILVKGPLQQEIITIPHKNKYQIYLTVKNFKNMSSRFIRFEAFGLQNNQRVFTDGLISSSIDRSFENIVQKVEKINAEK